MPEVRSLDIKYPPAASGKISGRSSVRYAGIIMMLMPLIVSACSTILTPTFGVRQGQLTPCPPRRDCISSQEANPSRHIAPLTYTSTRQQARSDLLIAINAAGHARIVSSHLNYIRVQYPITIKTNRSSEYYYQPENAVDEVEFYLEPGEHVIEMRSIARLGLLDIGANRARLEKISTAFDSLQQRHE